MSMTEKYRIAWFSVLGMLAGTAVSMVLVAQAAREETSRWQETESDTLRWLELDEQEWEQYRLRRSLVGQPLAEMTPYEVLGLYADDPQQQRRYARENARFMLDFYRRTMKFEEIYREELSRLSDK